MSRELEFKDWLEEVDKIFVMKIGLGRDDMPDQTYRDWFDSGMEPEEAVEACLENEGMEL